MISRLLFQLPAEAIAAWRISTTWALLPLRVPTGWAVVWNTVSARLTPSGDVEFNDSEDLILARKLPPPSTQQYDTEVGSFWRDVRIDGGWYRDHFKLVIREPDLDSPRHVFKTGDPLVFLATLERWLAEVVQHGDLRTPPSVD